MIRIFKVNDEEYVWRGTVDLGVLGLYKDDMIRIDLEDIEIESSDGYVSEEEKILKLSNIFEARFQQLSDNKDYLSEQFMMWMIEYLCDMEYPFWKKTCDNKYPSYINAKEIQKYEDTEGNITYSSIYAAIREYGIYKNKESLKSYEIVAKYLPVLNLCKMAETIRPEFLNADEGEISFQVSSDICGGLLFCSTYGTIDDDNNLEVTHNC